MPKSKGFSSHLNTQRQSTGVRPLIVFCLVSILLLTFYIREGESGPIHSVRGAVSVVTTPVRVLGSLIATPFNAAGNVAGNLTASQETLSELREQNAELTAARIIGNSSDAWSRAVTIDKGTAAGFSCGMAVCNSGGVIGQIVEVSATTSTVQLITDEGSGVSAMIQSTRAQGMLQGQPDGSLRLSYVSTDSDVKVGDIVITSGIGGVYPKGLPLGTVSSVEKSDNDVYYTIVVRAQSTAENNEEVLVITSLTDDQIASDQDVANANKSGAVTSTSTKDDDSSDDSSDDSE